MSDTSRIIESLNQAQQEAVTAPFGNLLVLAGAGSGKTRVLVYRIAWFIHQASVSSHSILAVTFTNKAATEMRGRLESMLGRDISGMWVGTFHGLSHKLLRQHWKEAALPENFQVIDSDDQLHIIRRIFKSLSINEERFEPKKAQVFINRKKDEGIRSAKVFALEGAYDQVMAEVYKHYEKHCTDSGLVDFAELLLRAFEVLNTNQELLSHYQARFLHFLVDEFQDTNSIQYQWLSLLCKHSKSITIVGDDDQSIYGWRGAKVENIHRFEKEFKETRIVRLEQNYRSTGTILQAANALIANNDNRLGKTLWTEEEKGDPICVYCAFNEEDEALYVMRQIRVWVEKGGRYQDIGILYRSNAQSRLIEEALVRAGIPYTIYGGLRFFERAEIKDALAYLRLAVNINDDTAFERIVNMPPRGIGERSVEKIKEMASQQQCSYWMGAKKLIEERIISGKSANSLVNFMEIVEGLTNKMDGGLSSVMSSAIHDSGLLRFYREQVGEKSQSKAENLEELINATSDFELEQGAEEFNEEWQQITAFLSYTALEAGDRKSDNESSVQLMTLHSAKGLEFPLVFICGLEDGLFPHHFSRENPKSLEEERRLCYVGITRAMVSLHLTYAEKRRLFGRDESRQMSMFIHEIPKHLLNESTRKVAVSHPFRVSFNTFLSSVPHSTPKANTEGYCLGQRVLHPKFGEGTVIDHEGNGERARIHIHFDKFGSKWLALSFAKLETV